MAIKQWDVAGAQIDANVVKASGSSIGASLVRVTIDDSNCPNRLQALQALMTIIRAIERDAYPPA